MSEEPQVEAAPKKKKGKLPVIIILALVLGAGGFFGMKARGGPAKPEKPVLKLGKMEKLDEFLVNLKEPNTYIRTTISLQFVEGFDAKKLEEATPAIRDAVILKLSAKSLHEVETYEGKLALKRELAESINRLLNSEKDEKGEKGEKPDAKTEPKPAAEKGKPAPPEHPDWDSQTGPVAKVLYTSFATQ